MVLVALPGDYGKPRPAVIVQSDLLNAQDPSSYLICPLATALSGQGNLRVAVEPMPSNGLNAPFEVMTRHRRRHADGCVPWSVGSMRPPCGPSTERCSSYWGSLDLVASGVTQLIMAQVLQDTGGRSGAPPSAATVPGSSGLCVDRS